MNMGPIAYRFFFHFFGFLYFFFLFSTHPWEADYISSQFWQLFSSENLILGSSGIIRWLLKEHYVRPPEDQTLNIHSKS